MTAHFLTSYHDGRRWCVGAFLPQQKYPVEMVYTLIQSSLDLELLTHDQAFSIWSDLWRSGGRPDAPEMALNRIAAILALFAPPGYTFQPWFVKGTVFWGWFPRIG